MPPAPRPYVWEDWLHSARMVPLNDRRLAGPGSCVVYWAQNAHRGVDNEALNAAIALGDDLGVGVVVYVAVHTALPHATERSYSFLIDGLRDMAGSLRYRGIRLVARIENPEIGVPRFIHEIDAAALVTDRSALQFGRALRALVTDRVEIPVL